MEHKHIIKFKQTEFSSLRSRLLEDLTSESFAILFGKRVEINNHVIINVIETKILDESHYDSKSISHVKIKKDYIHGVLSDFTARCDVDTIIDVHTHPFSKENVCFSGVDDSDEQVFFSFLNNTFEGINYASIVLSQSQYSARVWLSDKDDIYSSWAIIKTQTMQEWIKSADYVGNVNPQCENEMTESNLLFDRSILALGLQTMRQIMNGQIVTIVGLGGTGSIIAEHLIHMGFHSINLIDPDILEMSNMNRIVGAYYEDAKNKKHKVDVIKSHLERINPNLNIKAFRNDVYEPCVEKILALSDWIILATDNHSSRFKSQQIAFKYFVPFISLGVNISVGNNGIEDVSGEIITVRVGDRLCLNCMKRINPTKIAHEKHPDKAIRNKLVQKGYITGVNIKEPAVKTLNSLTATLAVETLINQYTGRQKHVPILVYEGTKYQSLYQDVNSVKDRNMDCFTCNI